MTLTAASTAKARLEKLRVARNADKAKPRRVSFHINGTDFMAVMFFNIGMESQAIANLTGLTPSQVDYRVREFEWEQRERAKREGRIFLTARRQFRKGVSPVNRMIVSQITGGHSLVKKYVAGVLDKRGLYAPKASGVLKDDSKH